MEGQGSLFQHSLCTNRLVSLLQHHLEIYLLYSRRGKLNKKVQDTWSVLGFLAQLCLTLCRPMDCSSPGSSVHGILQEIILELVAMLSSRVYSQPRDRAQVSCITGGFFSI